MTTISLTHRIDRPPDQVWAELERIEDHASWMRDAVSITFVGEQRRGVGTQALVETRVGPFRTTDLLEFTAWDPPRLMTVVHRGAVTGTGTVELSAEGGGTRLDWSEAIRFPWFLAGPLGSTIAKPILRRIWKGNLRRLEQRVVG